MLGGSTHALPDTQVRHPQSLPRKYWPPRGTQFCRGTCRRRRLDRHRTRCRCSHIRSKSWQSGPSNHIETTDRRQNHAADWLYTCKDVSVSRRSGADRWFMWCLKNCEDSQRINDQQRLKNSLFNEKEQRVALCCGHLSTPSKRTWKQFRYKVTVTLKCYLTSHPGQPCGEFSRTRVKPS